MLCSSPTLADQLVADGFTYLPLAPVEVINVISELVCGTCGRNAHESRPYWRGSRCCVIARCLTPGCTGEEEF